MGRKHCSCTGNTHLYGHNSGCPLNPMTASASGCLVPIVLGLVLGLSLFCAGVKL